MWFDFLNVINFFVSEDVLRIISLEVFTSLVLSFIECWIRRGSSILFIFCLVSSMNFFEFRTGLYGMFQYAMCFERPSFEFIWATFVFLE